MVHNYGAPPPEYNFVNYALASSHVQECDNDQHIVHYIWLVRPRRYIYMGYRGSMANVNIANNPTSGYYHNFATVVSTI